MKRAWVVLSIAIGMYGCSLLKQNSTKTSDLAYRAEEQSKLHELNERDSSSAVLSMHYEKDSLQEAYTIQVWPKGKFSFSATNGFEGEADRILITGDRQQVLHSGSLLNSSAHIKEKNNTELDQQKNLSIVQQDKLKKSSPDYRVIIGLIVLLIIAWRWLRTILIGKSAK